MPDVRDGDPPWLFLRMHRLAADRERPVFDLSGAIRYGTGELTGENA